ncbi:MAG: HIT family protein [Betaproteobacteria bacterium]|nr:HIT family protein [Betaproteobacteria bacterium]
MKPDLSLHCPLCRPQHETVLWQDNDLRVILAEEPDYPMFCRVIWRAHTKEMSDLNTIQQQHIMRIVLGVERVLRELLHPDKINLASLGNVVPHLHWHVIPRFQHDRHFPNPVWGVAVRGANEAGTASLTTEQLRHALQAHFSATPPS